jgi:hypothetical protein
MSVRRGPTERDRSEGTPTQEEPNQEHGLFGYFFLGRQSGLLEKVTRRKGGTILGITANNGYIPRQPGTPYYCPRALICCDNV